RHAVSRVGPHVAVDDEAVDVREALDDFGAQLVEVLLGDCLVDGPPPDLVPAGRLLDDEFVLGRTARVRRGYRVEGTRRREDALLAAHRLFEQDGRRRRPERTPGAFG